MKAIFSRTPGIGICAERKMRPFVEQQKD